MVLAGLVTAGDQFLFWQQGGFDSPVRLASLWTALCGPSSDPLWLYHAPQLEAWLMDQPLSAVLPVVGACMAWLGMDGFGRVSARL